MHQSLFESVKGTMILLPLLRDNDVVESEGVDMRDFDFVDFVIMVGATDIVVDAEAVESVNANMGTPSDVAGSDITQIASTEDNRTVIISVKKSTLTKRFAGVKVTIGDGILGANVAVLAVQYGITGLLPVTQHPSGGEAYETAEIVKV